MVLKHWNSQTRAVVEPRSLEEFKKSVDVMLRSMFCGEQGSPELMVGLSGLRGLSNLNDPVVLGKEQLLLPNLA